VYFSESRRDFLTSQVQLGGYEGPVLVRRSSLRIAPRSAVDQCIDQVSLGTRPTSSVPFRGTLVFYRTRIHFPCFGILPGTLMPTTESQTPAVVSTRAVLRTPYNSSLEFYTTTKHYRNIKAIRRRPHLGQQHLTMDIGSFLPMLHRRTTFWSPGSNANSLYTNRTQRSRQ